jgi:hypothetical protein
MKIFYQAKYTNSGLRWLEIIAKTPEEEAACEKLHSLGSMALLSGEEVRLINNLRKDAPTVFSRPDGSKKFL